VEVGCDDEGAAGAPDNLKVLADPVTDDGSAVVAVAERPHVAVADPVPSEAGTGQAAQQASRSRAADQSASEKPAAAAVMRSSDHDPGREVYGALDLGTNNCRLLLARPARRDFRVTDAFSRIIRLGEGVSQTGRLSDAAMGRTMDALRVCAGKLERHRVRRHRMVATQACRVAANGPEFLAKVHAELGLDIEVLDREAEASLAVAGCASLIDTSCDYVLVFDIGGGSSELIWLDLTKRPGGAGSPMHDRLEAQECIAAWISLSVGVVTLAERHGGRHVTPESFEAMVGEVMAMLEPFEAEHRFMARTAGARVHLLGTSGTVTTIAGIELGLPRYDRNKVDGHWLHSTAVRAVTRSLIARPFEARVAEPCIGADRADLVLAGCAILEALLRQWPCERLRVADRGLREGILATLMSEDGAYRRRRGRF
jgi:exopolyphosphatase/guanosine-5'-triphosphate,3'-diphosphate pyrophosphatase